MTLDLEQFIRAVSARAPDLDSDQEILNSTEATLRQLGEYVSGAAADRLAAELPAELRSALTPASPAPAGGQTGDFYAELAAREGTEPAAASAHAQAVLRAVAENVPADAVRAVRDQLTPELRGLFADESEGDTPQRMSAGPVEPDAPNVAGPERPVEGPDR